MTERQRWVAAADMLTSARNKRDGGSGLPPDALVTLFESDITEGCSADVKGLTVAETAVGVYLIGRDPYPALSRRRKSAECPHLVLGSRHATRRVEQRSERRRSQLGASTLRPLALIIPRSRVQAPARATTSRESADDTVDRLRILTPSPRVAETEAGRREYLPRLAPGGLSPTNRAARSRRPRSWPCRPRRATAGPPSRSCSSRLRSSPPRPSQSLRRGRVRRR